jgi:hypothetical protein
MRMIYKNLFLTELLAFLKSINNWNSASFYSSFYSSVWRCRICDQQFTCCVEIHIDVPQWFPLHMELTLRTGSWVTFSKYLTKLICPCNCYDILSPFL